MAEDEVLDRMLDHVHYETHQLLLFLCFGNGWVNDPPSVTGSLLQRSLIEAALIHLRCLIEFLSGSKGDRASARDYIRGWSWRGSAAIQQSDQLHSRLAHLGRARATEPSFDWDSWLRTEGQVVLTSFGAFLGELREQDPRRYGLFVRPRPDMLQITAESFAGLATQG